MARAQKKPTRHNEDFTVEVHKQINKLSIPESIYRQLTKLAADQQPFMKLNGYCEKVLTDHVKGKGK